MSVSNDMDDWTEEKCIQLIREFRRRPFLWDQKHRSYYRKSLRPIAWLEISKTIGMSEFCCRHKIGILMSSFRREKARTINSRKAGDPAKYYYSSWFGFKYMAFLLDKKSESDRRTRIQQGIEEDEFDEPDEVEIKLLSEDDVEFVDEEFNATDNYDTSEETHDNPPSPEPIPQPKKRTNSVLPDKNREPNQKKPKKQKTSNDNTLSSFHYVSASPPSSDCEEEITHFSKYIAAKMRKYSETTKNAVQQAICELLFKADMTKGSYQPEYLEGQLTEPNDTMSKSLDIKVSFSDSE